MKNLQYLMPLVLLGACSASPDESAQSDKKVSPFLLSDQKASAEFAVMRKAAPFQDNNGVMPPPGNPVFKLNHAWPSQPLPPLTNAPWQAAIGNGPINVKNAPAYGTALKAAVAANGRALISQGGGSFDASGGKWYNEPWLGSQRESISGTYGAGEFGPAIFPGTGLRATFNTHVLTYYDERAAATLNKVWGSTAMTPDLSGSNAQFDEGAIVVKAALFASIDPNQKTGWWDAMDGAASWNMMLDQDQTPGNTTPAVVWPGYVAQFDIIVKDSQSSPQTGWVFMTLVYDSRIQSNEIWDKMVILGVQWGNDPQATKDGDPLVENWNNPNAPLYATQTLGWGGRLSGPNDGGRNDIAVNGKIIKNAPDSSCMSCHSTSQWNVAGHNMPTFLLPSYSPAAGSKGPPFQTCGDDGKPNPNGNYICSPAPGSPQWMKWFQNRRGDQPMDAGSVATDFDEVFAFKSLKLWWAAVGPADQAVPMLTRVPNSSVRLNQYNGAPIRPQPTKEN